MNKLGFYLETTSGIPGLVEAIREIEPPTLLTHANDRGLLQAIRRDLSPGTFVVGRLYMDTHQQAVWLAGDSDRAARGEWLECDAAWQSGRAFGEWVLAHDFSMAKERYPNEPGGRLLIDAWMSLNECLPGPASDAWKNGNEEERKKLKARATAYDCFQAGFRERLQEEGLEAVAFNFGAGNFQTAEHYLDWFPRTLESYVYLGFHEYGWPTLYPDEARDSQSAAGLYRGCLAGISPVYPDRKYKVVITEAGLARLYHHAKVAGGDVGWMYEGETLSEEDYWGSLEWYNEHLVQDDYVLGACLFNVGPSGLWASFRHLGVDNGGNPITLMERIKGLRLQEEALASAPPASAVLEGRISADGQPVGGAMVRLIGSPHTLGSDPKAVVYAPTALAWSRVVTGFEGSAWNAWQKFVSREVAGLTYEEFKAQVANYNPSLARTSGQFRKTEAYAMPRSGATFDGPEGEPQVVWDQQLSGFEGDRWACWLRYVQGKVVGLAWEAFKAEVEKHNPRLAEDGYKFRTEQTYWLPRNAGQYSYTRVEYADALGTYRFSDLQPGRYEVEVSAVGCQPRQTRVDVDFDTTLDLTLETESAFALELESLDFATIEAAGPWVRTRPKDMRFFVQGEAFRFVGVNLRAIVHYGTGSFNPAAEKKDRRLQLEKAREIGARVIRFFLPIKDATPAQVGDRFAQLLDLIRQDFSEMYLLPALTDLYDNTPFHPLGDDEFYETQPDGWKILGKNWYTEDYKVNYLPFVEYIVNRFKGEPQIFAWEIGNELKTPHGGRPRDFIDFNLAVAARIRALDPGQLITTGMLSTCHAGIFDPGKERLYGSADIDFVTNHLYDFARKDDPNDWCLHKHDRFWAEKVGKPWLVEEAGFEPRHPDEDRGPIVEEDMNRWFGLGASGYMQWAFMAGGKNNGDGDWRHGMDEQSDWHRDWNSLAAVYRQRADGLRAV